MITPSFGLTATERVLPKLALDFTTASLDSRITFTRTTGASNPATYINSSGLITSATNNQPRFDYDPIALTCKGLLIEESRVNLLLQSNTFTTSWTATRASAVSQSVTAPDGASTAFKLTEDATAASTHFIQQNVTGTLAAYTWSVYAKAGERTWLCLNANDATNRFTYFDLANGTIGTNAAGNTASIQALGNGWYRCVVTRTAANTAISMRLFLATGDNVNTYNGDGTSGLYIYGAQLELGAFATSYIPTTSAALTRNADVATMTGTNFSDWFKATEGALLAIGSRFGTSNVFPRLVQFDDGTDNNAMNVAIYGSNNNAQANVTASGSAQTSFSTISGGANVTMGVALAYKTDNFGCSANASSPQIDTSGTVPTVNRAIFGARPSGPVYLNGYIKKVMYWPQRLTQNELQAFSK